MAIVFEDAFGNYVAETPLPPLPWWRRVLRLKRPAGKAYVCFHFKAEKGVWQFMEAIAEYPKGMDAVKLKIACRIDGNEVCIASIDSGS